MSLMSKVDTLKAKAQQDGANELDLMRAALVESQERYNQQSAQIALLLEKQNKRIEALEKAVERSNEQKIINIQSALEKATEAVMEPMKGKSIELMATIDEAGKRADEIGHRAIDWRNRAAYGLMTAVFFLLGVFLIQWHFAPDADYAKRIMWNIEYSGEEGQNRVNFFDTEESASRVYKNQQDYEAKQALKAANEKAMHGK